MSTRAPQLAADVAMALRFVRGLPVFLRDALSPAQAAAIVRERLDTREQRFLDLARRAIYANAASPARALLDAVGCEPGDLARLVRDEGLEGALRRLSALGVYVAVDEFKGRKPLVRGSLVLHVGPAAFGNPLAVPHLWSSTGGSRGAATPVQLDLACVRDRAVNMYLALVARGGGAWRKAVWGLRGMVPLLWYSAAEPRGERWFVQANPAARDAPARLRWTARLLAWESRLCGIRLPRPEYAPLDQPSAVLDWIAQVLREGGIPHLWTSPSAAVRLCETALARSVSIAGAQLTLTGEPLTPARMAAVRQAGANAVADYGSVESGGTVAYGCLDPHEADEVHVFTDVNAVVAADTPSLPRDALLISSLLPTSPFVLLNASMGDRASTARRSCGCAIEAHGWDVHLSSIRSFEKLTAGGVTFDDASVVRVLECVLPARFGGGPTDYQLLEELGESAHSRLRLLVHPKVGNVDVAAVRETFLAALSDGRVIERDMVALWRMLGTLEVCREVPRVSGAGKILHLVAEARESR